MGPLLRIVTLVAAIVEVMVARTFATSASPKSTLVRTACRDGNAFVTGAVSRIALLLVVYLMPVIAVAQQAIPEPLLGALREQVKLSLDEAPNYACRLRVHRVQDKASVGQKMEEHARIEVLYSGGKERFSWPGEGQFGDDELRDILVMGLSGSGSFAEHLRTVALGSDTVFGELERVAGGEGEQLRIPYRVPAARSGYLVNLDGNEIEAAIRGVITVRAPEMNVLAFTLEAVDLPVGFPASAVSESITYESSATIGRFRPPTKATQQMVERTNDVYSNSFQFEDCKEFRGESTVHFDDEGPTAAVRTPVANDPLPRGIPVELSMKTAIVWGKLSAGDEVEAELSRQIKWKGEVLANSGAKVLGRIVELKQISGSAGTGYYIGIQFYAIDDKGKTTPTALALETLIDMPKSARRGIAAMVRGETAPYEIMNRVRPDGRPYPGVGFVRVLGDPTGLPSGFSMRWVTEEWRAGR